MTNRIEHSDGGHRSSHNGQNINAQVIEAHAFLLIYDVYGLELSAELELRGYLLRGSTPCP